MNLKLVRVGERGVRVSSLLPEGTELVADWAWTPDGQGLAISLPRTEERPWRLERISLQGQRELLAGGEAGLSREGIYTWAPYGLTWSPDGRYLAYYLLANSSSLNADGVPLEVLDVVEPQKRITLGPCLPYRQWLAWSSQGNQLAFIQGAGREATENKRLTVLTLPGGRLTAHGQEGWVDSQPCWLPSSHRGGLCSSPGGCQTPIQIYLLPGERCW